LMLVPSIQSLSSVGNRRIASPRGSAKPVVLAPVLLTPGSRFKRITLKGAVPGARTGASCRSPSLKTTKERRPEPGCLKSGRRHRRHRCAVSVRLRAASAQDASAEGKSGAFRGLTDAKCTSGWEMEPASGFQCCETHQSKKDLGRFEVLLLQNPSLGRRIVGFPDPTDAKCSDGRASGTAAVLCWCKKQQCTHGQEGIGVPSVGPQRCCLLLTSLPAETPHVTGRWHGM
jgi:hypothetical protein